MYAEVPAVKADLCNVVGHVYDKLDFVVLFNSLGDNSDFLTVNLSEFTLSRFQ